MAKKRGRSKKIISVTISKDVEMQIKGFPDDIKNFMDENDFPEHIKRGIISEIDYISKEDN